jgi:hypothetical protein
MADADVPVSELRRSLRTYLDRTYAHGESFTVSRAGVAIAELHPHLEETSSDQAED